MLVFLIVTLMAITGCTDNTEPPIPPASTPQSIVGQEENLPLILNATVMESIIPDELSGQWEYVQNYSSRGTVIMRVTKPGNHISVITIQDKRTEELAKYAITAENFSYTQVSIDWEWSETRFNNAPAMMGTNIDIEIENEKEKDILMGELIAYPYDRYLVTAYIIGENDKIVDMLDLLDSLEFP